MILQKKRRKENRKKTRIEDRRRRRKENKKIKEKKRIKRQNDFLKACKPQKQKIQKKILRKYMKKCTLNENRNHENSFRSLKK